MPLLTNLIVTAYLSTSHPCSNGHYPRENYTCAAPRNIPFGTKLFIEGVGWRVVEDRTSIKYNGRIDIYMGTNKKKVLEFGKQQLQVIIYENTTKKQIQTQTNIRN